MVDQRRVLLSRAAAIGLRALVELAREPSVTLSGAELASRQRLPQPMLEQILLRLRRAGLVEARRGRHGGYRLAVPAESLPLAQVLQAVERPRPFPPEATRDSHQAATWHDEGRQADRAGEIPAAAADPRLSRQPAGPLPAAERPSPAASWSPVAAAGRAAAPSRAHDVPQGPPAEAGGSPAPGGGDADPDSLGASAGHRVEQQLRRRLERLVQLELQRLTLAELLYDQRSWEASLGPEGGVMVM